MKNNDCKSFCDSLCSRLQNKNTIIHHRLYTPDNEIEVSGDLNVGHQEEVHVVKEIVTSDAIRNGAEGAKRL